ncbi:hypothetical protein Acsp06_54090 [Actinomycetospora sp. NBRC 106375]|nr:hypothetical protein Acsp06_54090 [Actinomycetospora sp. NBRC 106375]
MERKGFDASDDHGWDLRRVQLGDGDLAEYFTKIAHEVTGSHRKEGRRAGGRTPMQLLADAVDTYEKAALARCWEWEQASERRRQLTWSTGAQDLRRPAELAAEASDEDVAARSLARIPATQDQSTTGYGSRTRATRHCFYPSQRLAAQARPLRGSRRSEQSRVDKRGAAASRSVPTGCRTLIDRMLPVM